MLIRIFPCKYCLPIYICWKCFKFSPRLLCIYTPTPLVIKYLPEVLRLLGSILCNQPILLEDTLLSQRTLRTPQNSLLQ